MTERERETLAPHLCGASAASHHRPSRCMSLWMLEEQSQGLSLCTLLSATRFLDPQKDPAYSVSTESETLRLDRVWVGCKYPDNKEGKESIPQHIVETFNTSEHLTSQGTPSTEGHSYLISHKGWRDTQANRGINLNTEFQEKWKGWDNAVPLKVQNALPIGSKDWK